MVARDTNSRSNYDVELKSIYSKRVGELIWEI